MLATYISELNNVYLYLVHHSDHGHPFFIAASHCTTENTDLFVCVRVYRFELPL